MDTFIQYMRDTFSEMKRVSWPTQKQTIVYTALVIGVSTIVALGVSLLDFGFSHALDWFVK